MNEYILLNDDDPLKLAKQVNEAVEDGWKMYGELATCPWKDHNDVLNSYYILLFQWMYRQKPIESPF